MARVEMTRAMRVLSRILFVVCGLVSLVTAALYVMLHGADLPVESEWVIFAGALGIVGLSSLAAGVVPRGWMARACGISRDDGRLFLTPLEFLTGAAAVFYAVAVVGFFAPHRWNLNVQVMLTVCPMYVVKMHVDPSAGFIFGVVAPMNAAVWGAAGVMAGYLRVVVGRR